MVGSSANPRGRLREAAPPSAKELPRRSRPLRRAEGRSGDLRGIARFDEGARVHEGRARRSLSFVRGYCGGRREAHGTCGHTGPLVFVVLAVAGCSSTDAPTERLGTTRMA